MKILNAVIQYLLGLAFAFFGLNGFFHFMTGEPPAGLGRDFATAMGRTHYMDVVSGIMLASGLLFLSGQFIPLALVLIAPVLVNIILFHASFDPALPHMMPGVVLSVLWVVLAIGHRKAFSGVFSRTG